MASSLNAVEMFLFLHLGVKFAILPNLIFIDVHGFSTVDHLYGFSPIIFVQLEVDKLIKILKYYLKIWNPSMLFLSQHLNVGFNEPGDVFVDGSVLYCFENCLSVLV